MSERRSLLIARLLWIFPALLLLLAVNQVNVAMDVRATLIEGSPARAEVLEVYRSNRVDVTIGYVRIRLDVDGMPAERQLPLPISLVAELEGRDSVDVRVGSGRDQEIVLEPVARPQWRMAAINAAISLLGFVLLSTAVFGWNRYLKKEGDPADARHESAA